MRQRALTSWKSASSAIPPKNQVQNETGKKAARRDAKATFWQSTILVQRARQPACPLPVVDDRGFAARALPLQRLTELPRCLLRCLLADAGQNGAQPAPTRTVMGRRCGDGLRGRHILDRPSACSETLSFEMLDFFAGLRGPPNKRRNGRRVICSCTKESVGSVGPWLASGFLSGNVVTA